MEHQQSHAKQLKLENTHFKKIFGENNTHLNKIEIVFNKFATAAIAMVTRKKIKNDY